MKKNIRLLLLSSTILANVSYGFTENVPFKETFNTDTDVTINYVIPSGKTMACYFQSEVFTNSSLEYNGLSMPFQNDLRYNRLLFLPANPSLPFLVKRGALPHGSYLIPVNNNKG